MSNKYFLQLVFVTWYLLNANTTFAYTHADSLLGGNGRGRDWWDVQKYVLKVEFDTMNQSIKGSVFIDLKVLDQAKDSIQIDMQEPMVIDNVFEVNGFAFRELEFEREGNVYWVSSAHYPIRDWSNVGYHSIIIYYHGKPKVAVDPPWGGGFIWKKDSLGNTWAAVACQGQGASVWWPCKDAQWDEPDRGVDIHLMVPPGKEAISNGKLVEVSDQGNLKDYHWQVTNPINNYDVTFYIGNYVHWHDTLIGEKGNLDLDFWVLKNNVAKAKEHFAVVKQMIHCFEYWLGPYPFYEDGYKLVDAPYLGMEHQSAIAYGNQYKMGYRGFDKTGTGIGNEFDYIIIHESGHEWFGNSITAKDMADNWIHEGITTYTESLFAECLLGKAKGQEYGREVWHSVMNNKPIIGEYGISKEGPGDIYDKGSSLIFMIRAMMNDDGKFRLLLRGLSKEFYHQTVTTQQVENYISKASGIELKPFFNQYLRTTMIPQLEYHIKNGELGFKFNNCVEGFTLPISVSSGKKMLLIYPTSVWQKIDWEGGYNIQFAKDYLIKVKE